MDKDAIIQFQQVTIKQGEKTILHDLNLSLYKGEFIAILGPNGSGKSTLLKAILGLEKPESGTITVMGKSVGTGNSDIGYSPQAKPFDPDLPITGEDYVRLGLIDQNVSFSFSSKKQKEKVMKSLEEFDAISLAKKKIGRMSGGEQQRISLAQSLISDPHLLLLDEPLANLDISYQAEILKRLSDYHKNHNHTILIVAHDVNPLLPYINRVIYLANTHATIGSPKDVITEETLSNLYGVPVKVFDVEGRIFVAAFDGIIH